jgi:hypothetical protein
MGIADRQKIAWIMVRKSLASAHGIDPMGSHRQSPEPDFHEKWSHGTARQATGQIEDPGRTANRIAEFKSGKRPIERASGFVTLTSDAHTRDATLRQDRGRGLLRLT